MVNANNFWTNAKLFLPLIHWLMLTPMDIKIEISRGQDLSIFQFRIIRKTDFFELILVCQIFTKIGLVHAGKKLLKAFLMKKRKSFSNNVHKFDEDHAKLRFFHIHIKLGTCHYISMTWGYMQCFGIAPPTGHEKVLFILFFLNERISVSSQNLVCVNRTKIS